MIDTFKSVIMNSYSTIYYGKDKILDNLTTLYSVITV